MRIREGDIITYRPANSFMADARAVGVVESVTERAVDLGLDGVVALEDVITSTPPKRADHDTRGSRA